MSSFIEKLFWSKRKKHIYRGLNLYLHDLPACALRMVLIGSAANEISMSTGDTYLLDLTNKTAERGINLYQRAMYELNEANIQIEAMLFDCVAASPFDARGCETGTGMPASSLFSRFINDGDFERGAEQLKKIGEQEFDRVDMLRIFGRLERTNAQQPHIVAQELINYRKQLMHNVQW